MSNYTFENVSGRLFFHRIEDILEKLKKYSWAIVIGAVAIGIVTSLFLCDDSTRLYIGSIAEQVF